MADGTADYAEKVGDTKQLSLSLYIYIYIYYHHEFELPTQSYLNLPHPPSLSFGAPVLLVGHYLCIFSTRF